MGTEVPIPTRLAVFTSRVEETPLLDMSTAPGPMVATDSREATASSEVPVSLVPEALDSMSPPILEPKAPAGHNSSGDAINLD